MFFPILLSTISGVLSVEKRLIEAAKTLVHRTKYIFTGIGPGLHLQFLPYSHRNWHWLDDAVAAEFTGVKSGYGLGYMIMVARDIQRPDL